MINKIIIQRQGFSPLELDFDTTTPLTIELITPSTFTTIVESDDNTQQRIYAVDKDDLIFEDGFNYEEPHNKDKKGV